MSVWISGSFAMTRIVLGIVCDNWTCTARGEFSLP
jgi:hypothetical protein